MYLVGLHLKGSIDSQMGHSREYAFKKICLVEKLIQKIGTQMSYFNSIILMILNIKITYFNYDFKRGLKDNVEGRATYKES